MDISLGSRPSPDGCCVALGCFSDKHFGLPFENVDPIDPTLEMSGVLRCLQYCCDCEGVQGGGEVDVDLERYP